MDLIPIWVIQSWTRSSLWVPFNSECSVTLILACADPNYNLCCAGRVSWASWHSSVSHTNCSLSWKWLWLILRTISPAPFTRQNSNTVGHVPDLSELIISWKIFLAYPSRKVWNIKRTFYSMELFFLFIYQLQRGNQELVERRGRKGEIAKLHREMSAMNQEESCFFQGLYQFTVWFSKNHTNCDFVSQFLLQSPCASEEFSHCTHALLPYTPCHRRLEEPGPQQALWGSFHHSQRKAGLTHFLFSFYTLALLPYKTSQCGCRLKGTCWKRGEGLEISTDWELLVS